MREDNTRTGFFERAQFEAVRAHLPDYAQPAATFAFLTGWRLQSEILPLRWSQVDFTAGIVRLEWGATKNREGRSFMLFPALRACLERQRALTDALQRAHGQIIPLVFFRVVTSRRRNTIQPGVPLKGFRRAWRTACRAVGVPGAIPHDLRRSAVRSLERAGVSRSVAMKMTGHKTESVYRRYAIVSEGDLRAAAGRLADLYGREGQPTDPMPPVRAVRADGR